MQKGIPRFIFICKIFFKYHLIDFFVQRKKQYLIKFLFKKNEIQNKSLPIRLRMALEDLGPIFIKFGQILSTRPDLLSIEYIKELSKLQDNVPPFNNQIAKDIIQKSLNKSINEIFKDFDLNPIASASIAQVYKAKLHNGDIVAVKVLRPNLQKIIEQDLDLINFIAYWGERFSNDGKRLKLREVVAEFDKYLHDELDLMREAANASQLRRNFLNSEMLIIPKVYFDYCSSNVLVIEWMNGIPISNIETLREKNIDLSKLSRYGVEIFFTQVFKFGFFHADMHPGNILVSIDGRYIALDFGIVGSLTNHDKRYLAINLLAFLNRDYHRVATAHIESNWVPANTNAEELEAAIRAVCEPFFNQPLSKISFGFVLMRLFETSRRFNVEIQPQLVLLQKTLLNVEGLGRQLDPNLNLWDTAKPFLTKWMNEQIGPKAFLKNIKKESIDWADIFPTLPRKINTLLDDKKQIEIQKMQFYLLKSQQRQNLYLIIILIILLILLFLK